LSEFAQKANQNVKMPDVIGALSQIQYSQVAKEAILELDRIYDFLRETEISETNASTFIQFAIRITQIDGKFVEMIRDEICEGLDTIDSISLTVKTHLDCAND
jgi:hypothetical protein